MVQCFNVWFPLFPLSAFDDLNQYKRNSTFITSFQPTPGLKIGQRYRKLLNGTRRFPFSCDHGESQSCGELADDCSLGQSLFQMAAGSGEIRTIARTVSK